jgi:hypothetical protein
MTVFFGCVLNRSSFTVFGNRNILKGDVFSKSHADGRNPMEDVLTVVLWKIKAFCDVNAVSWDE